MNEEHTVPKVIIDLDEYNRLKEQIKDTQYNTLTYLKERITVRKFSREGIFMSFGGAHTVGTTSEQALMEYLNNVLGIVSLLVTTNDGTKVELQLRNEKEMR